ncbi:MAG TPA: LysR substrate-binding domain-containing protein [Kofleriaceae bacterium]|jgi:DNA-binding transcriptional LysR family regulator|nr:LysR substrate-binding domain-containing protein [Kofleriaceae bacterium]
MKRKDVLRFIRPGFDELAAAEIFLQVVEVRGFSRAAKLVGRSTSTLSRAVAQLEHQLGAQLLARTTRRVSLTEAGRLYARHAKTLVEARYAAHDAVTELTGGVPHGHLRVAMPVSVGERLLAPHLPELRRRYPGLRLEIYLSDRNVPLVKGGFDLAIHVGRQSDSSLRAQLLGRVPVQLVASPSYLAAHGEPARPRALRDHACITIAQVVGPVGWSFYHRRERTRSERLEVEGVVHTTSPMLAAQLACAGQGILRVNEWVIRDQLARGELVEILRDWSCYRLGDGGLPLYVVYAQTASAEPPLKSRVFVTLIKEILAAEVVSPPAARRGSRAQPR